jgi:hypothetical protein
VPRQKIAQQRAIADVALDEKVPRIRGERVEIADVAGVRQLVEIDDRLSGRGKRRENEVRADESGPAGDEQHLGLDSRAGPIPPR